MKLPEASLASPSCWPANRHAVLSPLPTSFYLENSQTVAPKLLGKGLYYKKGKHEFLAQITEVEAYLGKGDPACHASRGKTKRTAPMFEPGGICYVYLIYGFHYCMNVVTGPKGVGEAVLIRALEPLEGHRQMRKNRNLVPMSKKSVARNQKEDWKILSGPGKLTQALGVDLTANGLTFAGPNLQIVDLGTQLKTEQIATSPRIGISQAKDLPLRFFIKDSLWLSK